MSALPRDIYVGDAQRRHESLAQVRYMYDTLHDLARAIQTGWPVDRPMPPAICSNLNFTEMALIRIRNDSELRRLAEIAR